MLIPPEFADNLLPLKLRRFLSESFLGLIDLATRIHYTLFIEIIFFQTRLYKMKNGSVVSAENECDGNTNSSHVVVKKRIAASKNWCFTLNNYSLEDYGCLEVLMKNEKICKYYIMGKEIGKEKSIPHLQGYISFVKPTRPLELRNLPKTIHWEKAKGTAEDNLKYCSKDGDFITNIEGEEVIEIIKKLYPWQEKIEDFILNTKPDGRTLHWYYEETGGTGKSAFCKYMYIKHKCIIIQGGKLADIINIMYNADLKGVKAIIIDIPRTHKNKVSYSAIECLLNGMITNTKFETGVKAFNPKHVIVFSNSLPELTNEKGESNLSNDRWNINKLILKNV